MVCVARAAGNADALIFGICMVGTIVGNVDQRVATGIPHADAARKTIRAKIRIGLFIGLNWVVKIDHSDLGASI